MTFKVYRDKKEKYRWRLLADNNKIVADSGEGYSNWGDCVREIQRIQHDASTARIEED